MPAKRYTISAGLSAPSFDAVMAEAHVRGLSPSELLRVGLRALGIPIPKTAQEWCRLATKPTRPTRPTQPTQPTPPARSVTFTGLTPRAQTNPRRSRGS